MQSERTILAEVLNTERFDNGRYEFVRTHLRVLWDLTQAAGREEEVEFADGIISVVDGTGVPNARMRGPVTTQFVIGGLVVVSLNKIRLEDEDFVGEWQVVHGNAGVYEFNVNLDRNNNYLVEPMRAESWQRLKDHSTAVLTFLGLASAQAEEMANENIALLESIEVASASPTRGDLVAQSREELIAQSERTILGRVLEQEEFDDGNRVYRRTHLQVLWDLTRSSGNGVEPDFLDGETSVVEWIGIVNGRMYDIRPAIFWKGEVVVVSLNRLEDRPGVSTFDVFEDMVGEWRVAQGRSGKAGFNNGTMDIRQVVNPMREENWQNLLSYSSKVLTFLGGDSKWANLTARRHIRTLRPDPQPARKILQTSPQISSISPTSVSAGTDSTVTLTGSNFGSNEGTVYLFFDPGAVDQWRALTSDEIDSWSDTLITFTPASIWVNAAGMGFPSSGEVLIETTASQRDTSSQVLDINFSYFGQHWEDSSIPIVYRMNSTGTADCTGEFSAVEAAFDTWQNIGSSYVTFERGADTTLAVVDEDGVSLVLWESWGPGFANVIAGVAPYGDPIITEIDISFNDDFDWTTSGQSGRYDVQNVATHEIGHTLLLEDLYGYSDSLKTMYGLGDVEETHHRDLTTDDIAGCVYIYPALVSGDSDDSHLWAGTIHVTGDVDIQSGDILTVRPGTNVTFAADSDDQNSPPYTGKSALEVHGTLVAEGTSADTITFKSDATSPEKGDWDGILFWDSSVDADCKVNYTNIQHAQRGIYGSSATPGEMNNNEISHCVYGIQGDFDTPTIQNNTLANNNYGLYLYNAEGTGNGIQSNIITDSVTEGLYLSNCSIPIYGCNIVDNNRGATIAGGTTSTLDSCTVDSNDTWGIYAYGESHFTLLGNRIANNTTYGLRLYGSTNPYLNDPDHGNEFYHNGTYELYLKRDCEPEMHHATSGLNDIVTTDTLTTYAVYIDQSDDMKSIDAGGNWWGSADPPDRIFSPRDSVDITDPSGGENVPGSPKLVVDPIQARLDAARQLERAGDLVEASAQYRALVEDELDHPRARRALSRMYTTWRNSGQDMLAFPEFAGELEHRATNPDMRRDARTLKLRSLLNGGRIAEALEGYRAIAAPAPTSPEGGSARINIADVYHHYLFDIEAARAEYAAIAADFAGETEAELAQMALADLEGWASMGPASAELVAYDEEPLEEEPPGIVLAAAPNPANPAMALRFTLPEAMQVELVIYNMLGQKVRTLVPLGPWLAGEHRVVWDGKNSQGLTVSTGVYVAKLRAGEQVKSRKLTMLR